MISFSHRTQAATTTFAAYFTAQQAMLFTTDGVTLGLFQQYQGQLFSAYQILITQPAATPGIPPFPLVSNDFTVLDAAISTASATIADLNTTVQTLTVAEAQAAASARAFRNALPGGLAQAAGFLEPDSAYALAQLKQRTANLFASINAVQISE